MITEEERAYALALEQNTPEWLQYKVGKVSASKISDITAKLRNGIPSASRATYLGELIAERLTEVRTDNVRVTPAMEWGTAMEPVARKAYQFHAMALVQRVGCVLHPFIDGALCSPDGLLAPNGMVEIKCPNTNTHVDFVLGAAIPSRYLQQMQWQLACTGRQWVDYVSFDPRLPEHLRLWVQRVPRDNEMIDLLEWEVKSFLYDLEQRLAALGKIDATEVAYQTRQAEVAA